MNWALHYERFIEKAVRRGSKREKGLNQNHHIDPECRGGLKTPENMVYLYHREHLIAHLLLVKIYPDDAKLIFAAFRMSKGKRNGSRKYAWLKEKYSEMQSEKMSGKIRGPLSEEHREKLRKPKSEEALINMSKGQKGKIKGPLTEAHRKKISESEKGKILTKATQEKIAKTLTGISHPEERRKKQSESQKEIKPSEETRKKMKESQKIRRKREKGIKCSE